MTPSILSPTGILGHGRRFVLPSNTNLDNVKRCELVIEMSEEQHIVVRVTTNDPNNPGVCIYVHGTA